YSGLELYFLFQIKGRQSGKILKRRTFAKGAPSAGLAFGRATWSRAAQQAASYSTDLVAVREGVAEFPPPTLRSTRRAETGLTVVRHRDCSEPWKQPLTRDAEI